MKAKNTPGHTEGSFVLYGNGYLFTGDTLFKMGCGRTDLYSGNQSKIEDSLKFIAISYPDDTIVCPGHGPTSDIKFERDNNPYIKSLL